MQIYCNSTVFYCHSLQGPRRCIISYELVMSPPQLLFNIGSSHMKMSDGVIVRSHHGAHSLSPHAGLCGTKLNCTTSLGVPAPPVPMVRVEYRSWWLISEKHHGKLSRTVIPKRLDPICEPIKSSSSLLFSHSPRIHPEPHL